MKRQCTIVQYMEQWNEWCLLYICNTDNAEQVLEEAKKEYPNKKLRINYENTDNAWWNTYGCN